MLFVVVSIACLSFVYSEVWSPCDALGKDKCYGTAFDESSVSTIGSAQVEKGITGSGSWSISNGVLKENSRTSKSGSFCAQDPDVALGQILWLNANNINVGEYRQIRVKVRITAEKGAAGIIFSEKDDDNYFRFISAVDSCPQAGLLQHKVEGKYSAPSFSTGSELKSNKWVELRARVHTKAERVEWQWIEQEPEFSAASSQIEKSQIPFLVAGGRIGLWCSASGISGGCEFDDFVVVADEYRGSLTGPLSCHACNLNWQKGQEDWCRCCQQDCAPFEKSGCLNNGLCNTVCMDSIWCTRPTIAPTSPTSPTGSLPTDTPVSGTPKPATLSPTPPPTPAPAQCTLCQTRDNDDEPCVDKCDLVKCQGYLAGWTMDQCMVYVADVQACEDGVCPSTTFNEQACSIGAALAPNAECKDTRCINRDACERGKLAKDFGGIDNVCLVNQQGGCDDGQICDHQGACVKDDGQTFTVAPTPAPTPEPTCVAATEGCNCLRGTQCLRGLKCNQTTDVCEVDPDAAPETTSNNGEPGAPGTTTDNGDDSAASSGVVSMMCVVVALMLAQ